MSTLLRVGDVVAVQSAGGSTVQRGVITLAYRSAPGYYDVLIGFEVTVHRQEELTRLSPLPLGSGAASHAAPLERAHGSGA